MQKNIYKKYIKNILDIIFALALIIFLAWLFLLIAIVIFIDDPGKVIIKQKRIGENRDGKLTYFYIYKFRTMKLDAPEVPTHLMEEPDKWITRTGKWLRKLSLDELPQLWNIAFFNNLSFVGPRPALWSQTDLYEERERYGANDVKPGLTGWAQVNGRDTLSIRQKAGFDGQYAENINFKMDCLCIWRTFKTVLTGENVVEGKQKENEPDSLKE